VKFSDRLPAVWSLLVPRLCGCGWISLREIQWRHWWVADYSEARKLRDSGREATGGGRELGVKCGGRVANG
jgi:hypothetical protein